MSAQPQSNLPALSVVPSAFDLEEAQQTAIRLLTRLSQQRDLLRGPFSPSSTGVDFLQAARTVVEGLAEAEALTYHLTRIIISTQVDYGQARIERESSGAERVQEQINRVGDRLESVALAAETLRQRLDQLCLPRLAMVKEA